MKKAFYRVFVAPGRQPNLSPGGPSLLAQGCVSKAGHQGHAHRKSGHGLDAAISPNENFDGEVVGTHLNKGEEVMHSA